MSETDLILYQFSRMKVEQSDFTHFLSLYAPNKLQLLTASQAAIGAQPALDYQWTREI